MHSEMASALCLAKSEVKEVMRLSRLPPTQKNASDRIDATLCLPDTLLVRTDADRGSNLYYYLSLKNGCVAG